MKKLLEELVESTSHTALEPPHNTHLHYAAIIQRGNVLALARNSILSTRPTKRDATKHAERAAIENLGDLSQLKGSVMFVWRVSRTGETRMSKPCKSCTCMLESCFKKWGLKKVIYTP